MALRAGDTLRHAEDTSGLHCLTDEDRREMQDDLLEMTQDIIDYCGRHGVEVMLGGGTCLGAVRHHGFIPWDDDVDLNVARAGWDKFVAHFDEELGDRYALCVPGRTSGYEWRIPQVRKRGTHVADLSSLGEAEDGLFVDLFIIESCPDSPVLRGLQGIASLALTYLLSCRRYHDRRGLYLDAMAAYGDGASKTVRTKSAIGALTCFTSFETLARAVDRVNSMCGSSDSETVTIPSGRKFYFGERVARSVLLPPSEGEFEGKRMPIPRDAGSYLKGLYGDYMQVPPEAAREHHYYLRFDLGRGHDDASGQ